MAGPMPTDNPFLAGNSAPINFEGESAELAVVGEVPRELNGAYFRNGANPQFPPIGQYHLFDGDGMVHGFYFEDGRVHYRSRWVRTERFMLERAAGRALFASMVEPGRTDPSVVGKSTNAANTHVIQHAGKLLALWEAGLPTELDPETLDTIGLWDFHGQLKRKVDPTIAAQVGMDAIEGLGPGIMSAHPKIDPKTGELLFFGYSAAPPHLVFNVVSPDGKLVRNEEIDVPYAAMMHDFLVTEEHVLFPIFPAAFDYSEMEAGTGIIAWKPELGTHIGVMPRSGGNADVRWIESDPCYVFHFANGWSDGDRITAEMCRFPVLPMFGGEGLLPPSFWRWTIDLSSSSVREEPIDETPAEFPRIDDRFAGLPSRHVWVPSMAPEEEGGVFGFNVIAHFDTQTGERKLHRSRPGSVMGEPVFVPRSADADEGDGYVIVLAYREPEKRSDLLVLDALNIDAEPIAEVQLPVRVPSGFHGSWLPRT